jgi:hypothetical protein
MQVGSQINVLAALSQKNKLDTPRSKRLGGPQIQFRRFREEENLFFLL